MVMVEELHSVSDDTQSVGELNTRVTKQGPREIERRLSATHGYASTSLTTLPFTSVRRKSRPA